MVWFRFGFIRLFRLNPLVMIMHRNGQCLFGVFLADAMQVEQAPDFRWLRNVELRQLLAVLRPQFLVEHVFADDDATVADVNAWPLNEFFDFGV